MLKIHLLLVICPLIPTAHAGFGDPNNAARLVSKMQGRPCDCKGGFTANIPAGGGYQKHDCGDKTAYLHLISRNYASYTINKWQCVKKPKPIPPVNGRPGPCPNECTSFYSSVHSACYSFYQTCTRDNTTYFTATITGYHSGTFGGDWSSNVNPLKPGGDKFRTFPCPSKGSTVCWHCSPPVHVSDGGGPQDLVRQIEIKKTIDKIIQNSYPELFYHPLLRPNGPSTQTVETVTMDLVSSTHLLLNNSNPTLASDCWLCLKQGPSTPDALYFPPYIPSQNDTTCIPTPPFQVNPQLPQHGPDDVRLNITCFYKPYLNESEILDVGNQSLCEDFFSVSQGLCADNGTVFVCGDNLAYTFLPRDWTGSCMPALLLPDISVIKGDTPVPIPTFEHIAGRPKRAIQFLPLLATLGITAAVGTGATGMGVAVTKYREISRQLIQDVQILSSTIQDIQDQIDSLAEVVLQNRRGLDLLTAQQGGICLALGEQCCFYANKSGIVRDRVKRLQEDLEKRRLQLIENPLWTGLGGVLPYLLPLLGPLLGIILLLTFGPWAFNRLTRFVKTQVDSALRNPEVHYHRLVTNAEDVPEIGYAQPTPYDDCTPKPPPPNPAPKTNNPMSLNNLPRFYGRPLRFSRESQSKWKGWIRFKWF